MAENLLTDEEREAERIAELAATVRKRVRAEIARHTRLIKNLKSDLEKHGDPSVWKRYGDLLLANTRTARREGDAWIVTDLFDEAAGEIAIASDPRENVSQAAENYFKKYAKARNGREVIFARIEQTEKALASAQAKLATIEKAVVEQNEDALNALLPKPRVATEKKRPKKKDAEVKGVRTFVSTDGFEILVGKTARDNDHLTSRIAAARDTWMHAADYAGSHVVIRNPNRKEIPQRTLLEAASLAAFYSNARQLDRAAVNYTERKFVNKVKGGAPGLVRLASFRTLLVKPTVPFEREEN